MNILSGGFSEQESAPDFLFFHEDMTYLRATCADNFFVGLVLQ